MRQDAGEAWADYASSASGAPDLDEPAFRRAYFRAHGPRGSLHALAGVVGAALITAPALALLGAAWRIGWRLSGEPFMFREGLLMWQFYLFFGMIGSWVLVAALVMSRYHRNRPRKLPNELARERDRVNEGG